MTRYYFDLRDADGIIVDDEGLELTTFKRAQEEAARSLADMVRDAATIYDGKVSQEMAVEVRDDFGPVLLVRFTFEFDRLRKQS
ncbi:DUF6894 family protein [Bradyrhizobium acaciae]|uniref:DUF6894 family protein n=1 Tax=Bradyrhizobium acaciae TaxID=2683706 RepID=UPI001E4A3570|nr:hypothetical protein [Bradyrhizobium acaciae]MCC8983347.1 hypothetical protein [Bradyrhizobium acaciae]